MADRQRAMFAEAGLPRAEAIERVPSSRRALALGELARDRGVFDRLHRRLFDAYWARGLDLGDEAVLVEEGRAAGLDAEDVATALADEALLARVQAATRAALELGAGGVPAWLVDERVLVPGAQPHDVFERVLEWLGHAAR